uniref:Uncharacterized protein n=1 Tax=Psilocybe cubensis TaxID=181762 RepID=A0A8H8CEZ1_PSICU
MSVHVNGLRDAYANIKEAITRHIREATTLCIRQVVMFNQIIVLNIGRHFQGIRISSSEGFHLALSRFEAFTAEANSLLRALSASQCVEGDVMPFIVKAQGDVTQCLAIGNRHNHKRYQTLMGRAHAQYYKSYDLTFNIKIRLPAFHSARLMASDAIARFMYYACCDIGKAIRLATTARQRAKKQVVETTITMNELESAHLDYLTQNISFWKEDLAQKRQTVRITLTSHLIPDYIFH